MEPSAIQTSGPLVEKRRLPRLKVSAAIQFRNLSKPQDPFCGSVSRDVGAGGLCMSSPLFLPVDARVVLLLLLPGIVRPIRGVGRVVWTQQRRFLAAYDCGIEFVEVAPEDREVIAERVERGVMAPPPSRRYR